MKPIERKVKQLGLTSVMSILCTLSLSMPSIAADVDCTYGKYTCVQGYVWRDSTSDDKFCVTPEVRKDTKHENELHAGRVDPNSDRGYCKSGFVWRDAVPGDHICVTPASRARANQDNRHANVRKACPSSVL